MQFLKILFWCLLAFVAAVFTIGNWTTVPIKLWGGLIAEVNLPLLLLVTFLAGLLPTMAYYQAIRWRLRNRLGAAERALADLRMALMPASAPPPMLHPDAVVVPEAVAPTPPQSSLPPPPPSGAA